MTETIQELEIIVNSDKIFEQTLKNTKNREKVPEVVLYYATEQAYDLFDERCGTPRSNAEIAAFSAIPVDDFSPILLTTQDIAKTAFERGYAKFSGTLDDKAKDLKSKNSFLGRGISSARKKNLLDWTPGLTKLQKSILDLLLKEKESSTRQVSLCLVTPVYTIRAAAKSLEIRNLIEINYAIPKHGGREFSYKINEAYLDIIALLVNRKF